ncbi:alpha/beta fold hydrolase [Rubrimonas sp.]|uniref:alpha/beta fold hydrolase n=1 Tax=Rubrimonas sp. TaxID=2036015 RepID=UPI002FDE38F7
MGHVNVGEGVRLAWRAWGEGSTTVAFIHGNLASKEWFELVARRLPRDLRVIGFDWRGCGDSDRPEPGPNYANYAMERHAADMLEGLDALGVGRCHLITHSTGGYIAALMELAAPGRFPRILDLDPVSPKGMAFDAAGRAVFEAMKSAKAVTRAVMASAAPTLFDPSSLTQGRAPAFLDPKSELARFYDRIVDQTFGVSDGVWLGTPFHLDRASATGGLTARMGEMKAERLIVWGEQDLWIPQADVEAMAAGLPNARLVKVPGVGHSMNLEAPDLFAGFVGAHLGGAAL